jgi:hypothetical protein
MRKLFMVFLVVILAIAGLVTMAGPAVAVHTECHDGIDNDGNGLTDFPDDPGCSSIDDFHEEGFVPPRAEFSCRASAIRVSGLIPIGTIEPFVANAPLVPCKTDNNESAFLTSVTVGPVSAAAVQAFTAGFPDAAIAFARVAGASVGIGPGISAEYLFANATVACSGGSPEQIFSSSTVTGLTIGSSTVDVPPGHFHITIPGVGTLHLNETITTPNSVVRRAFWLATPSALLPDVVIAEAHADYTGNPCAAP